ncbi:MAG: metallophosphoesterase [Clostridia bacterium]|nr:metallophosphoesterase [Clostridia bacterium]
MKFLFFTDTHIRGTTPKNRKDNFYETLTNKFREIRDLSCEYKVDYILHGGDWFDRPDVSPSIVREFAILIKEFNKPVFTVAGNHDIYGHNPDTVGRSMLGIIEGIGIISLLKTGEDVILEKNNVKIQLSGSPYYYDVDGENFRKYYITKKKPGVKYSINMVHGMLLQKPFYEGIHYTLIDDIRDTEADITLAGHYHNGFGVIRFGEKYFINTGSIVRVANSMGELKRRPKVAVIEMEEEIKITEIELASALPGEEVLDRTQLESSQDRILKLHQFYQGISSNSQFKRIDINRILEEISANSEISTRVKEESLRRIAIARENFSNDQDE